MKLKSNSKAKKKLVTLRNAAEDAADQAITKVIKQAEQDAREQATWHTAGEHQGVGKDGSIWVWEITGLARDSIFGSVITTKRKVNPPRLDYGETTVTRDIPRADGSYFEVRYTHQHHTSASLRPTYTAVPGVYKGVLGITAWYAAYLQNKEIYGAAWGSPKQLGSSITQFVFQINWEPVYLPLMKKTFQNRLRRAI